MTRRNDIENVSQNLKKENSEDKKSGKIELKIKEEYVLSPLLFLFLNKSHLNIWVFIICQ